MLISSGDVDRGSLRALVDAFYLQAREDPLLGPVFEQYVSNWDEHLARMTDFWASLLLRDSSYSGHPFEMHRAIPELTPAMFDRWVDLFGTAARRQFGEAAASKVLDALARRMSDQLTRAVFGRQPEAAP